MVGAFDGACQRAQSMTACGRIMLLFERHRSLLGVKEYAVASISFRGTEGGITIVEIIVFEM